MNFPYIFYLSLTSFIGVCVCSFNLLTQRNKVLTYGFLMPFVYPDTELNHLCMKIAIYNNFYLVGFEPKASFETVHQMLLYGCTEPGSNDTLWDCNETPTRRRNTYYDSGAPCNNGSQLIYAWAGNASGYQLPRDIGFHIGKYSDVKYLVLQVHYRKSYTENGKIKPADNSGLILSYTRRRMSRLAGVLMLGAKGMIPPNTVEHMESTCTITEDKVIHPISFRVHTHKYGSLVSCYVVRQGKIGDTWTTLAKKSPKKPQAFYPVKDGSPIRKGDILASRCTMNNTSNNYVRIGNTNKDEVCSFQLLYWADTKPLNKKFCISAGPPAYYWNRALENFHNIPDFQASVLNTNKDEVCSFQLLYWADTKPLNKKFCISAGPPAYYWNRALENFHNIPDFQASVL